MRDGGALAQEGHPGGPRVVTDADAVAQHAHPLPALDARANVERAARRAAREINDAQRPRGVETREDRVDHAGVALEHGDVQKHAALVGHEPQRIEASEMGAEHEGPAPGIREPLQVLPAVHDGRDVARVAEEERHAVDDVQRELVKMPERVERPRRARGAAVALRPAVQTQEVPARGASGRPTGDEEIRDDGQDQVPARPAAEDAIAPDDEIHPEE